MLAGCSASILFASAAAAQPWPQRPVRLIVPYPVGGLTDNISRTLGDEVARLLGQNVIIENRAGAGGKIGLDLLKQSPADGYTIGLAVTANMVTLPLTNPNFGIDPARDFEPITLAVRTHQVLVVSEQLKVRTLKDFVAYAKQHPDRLSYGTPGAGTSFHFNIVRMEQKLGIRGLHIPYKGEGPVLADLASGQIQFTLTSNPSSGLIASGKIVPLAVASKSRIAPFPDLPTFAELGVDFASDGWVGYVAPKGVPEAILDRLNAAFVQAVQSPKVQQTLRTMGYTPDGSSRKEFAKVIADNTATYSELLRSGAVKLE
ncbi:MAG: hypothetical protein ABS43_31375 [Bordetella sp. SCN 67-23]|nr:MAG: hypothetical protein ABS43_31375 [Bordetella sp. SCN 67-23]